MTNHDFFRNELEKEIQFRKEKNLGLLKELNIPNFKLVEFEQFKINAGSNTFILPLNKIARNQLKSLIDN